MSKLEETLFSELLAFTGHVRTLSENSKNALISRQFRRFDGLSTLPDEVKKLVLRVQGEGDKALYDFASRFDHVKLSSLEVEKKVRVAALENLDVDVRRALERAKRNLETVNRAMFLPPTEVEVEPGLVVGRRCDPLQSVGVYAPGGTASYPSSVLMGVVPAVVAGVKDVFLCSPPGPNGRPSDIVLAAAELAGASRVFAIGGAGAIAAFAFGTETVPRVDRIVGPGNAWVAEAKRQLAADVLIDSPAGPSEILIIADECANPEWVAKEMLAQAEHDPDACNVALVLSNKQALQIMAALKQGLVLAPRKEVIERSLATRSAVLIASDLDEACTFSNSFAPEHLLLAVSHPDRLFSVIRNAGTVFMGNHASVAFGDYLTGANHVLPTAGAAKRYSGLSVLDFVRYTSFQKVDEETASRLAHDAGLLARHEGLFAHAEAALAHAASERDTQVENGRKRIHGLKDSKSADETEALFGFPPFRKNLSDVVRYVPDRPQITIDLTDNTNLWGFAPQVLDLFKQLSEGRDPSLVTRYPEPYVESLRVAIGEELGVTSQAIVTGCGSDDVIDATVRAFVKPGEVMAYVPPTFSMAKTFAQTNGAEPVATKLDLDELVLLGAKVIYLCSPNNPTGEVLPHGFVDELLKRSSSIVLLDEAYIDYASCPSLVTKAAVHPRLIVVRTFSKAFALAGLRVGYAVAHPRVILEIEKTRGPYKVGKLAERAALLTLKEGRAWVRSQVEEVKAIRAEVMTELSKRHIPVFPSESNFLLLPFEKAEEITLHMRQNGVSVRAFSSLPNRGNAIRVSIGPREMMAHFLNALSQALAAKEGTS